MHNYSRHEFSQDDRVYFDNLNLKSCQITNIAKLTTRQIEQRLVKSSKMSSTRIWTTTIIKKQSKVIRKSSMIIPVNPTKIKLRRGIWTDISKENQLREGILTKSQNSMFRIGVSRVKKMSIGTKSWIKLNNNTWLSKQKSRKQVKGKWWWLGIDNSMKI